ncbi:odorant receptor 9a-like [Odontomachus brunneus]|uniref:odorant receptor 9a-like n=1 Tax=Odontomachus brunneus TaxID=486640 RepID=UPI0013F2ABE5|nr:odorant receptor 9a-like [Odontomachus brunneus]
MILDVMAPLNESRPRQLIVMTEYFVNQDKYFYIIFLHEFISCSIGAITLCSTGTTLMIYIYHVCALFKIASHRIEYAFVKRALETRIPGKKCLLYRRIVHAVVIHRKATKFIENLTSEFVPIFLVLISVGVCSLSFSLFQFFQLITLTDDTDEMFIFAILIFANLTYMFTISYGGQEVMEHGIQFFRTTYNVPWYAAPLQIQKLLLLIMRKGTRNVTFTCVGVLDASLQGFASVKLKLRSQRDN